VPEKFKIWSVCGDFVIQMDCMFAVNVIVNLYCL